MMIMGGSIWQWECISSAFSNMVDHIAGKGGLSLSDVAVEGRNQVSSNDILSCLNLKRGETLTQFNPHETKACLEKNPWVRSATVIRQYPQQIQIQLVEREPIAIWQYKSENKLLDREGAIIFLKDVSPYSHLMIVAGEKAPENLGVLNEALANFPDVKEHISAAIHVRGKRWDLKMNNGMIVKLPEDHIDKALNQLRKLADQNHLWERDYSVLDMRLQDQLILKPAKTEKSKQQPEKDV
ncbi:Cell division protein FtsQ [Candidatus Bealeia paramacronuclearis]|uniref:Cell division protein FtsQ n=3 Tax=Candidatus Bealeia paramacronuclearis TaxID=1921001 RepID=A0ABZ2C0M2_9PROT|nr:Cell division protein FtsQ [Candidatus Bealeia paramacronuclearis]